MSGMASRISGTMTSKPEKAPTARARPGARRRPSTASASSAGAKVQMSSAVTWPPSVIAAQIRKASAETKTSPVMAASRLFGTMPSIRRNCWAEANIRSLTIQTAKQEMKSGLNAAENAPNPRNRVSSASRTTMTAAQSLPIWRNVSASSAISRPS